MPVCPKLSLAGVQVIRFFLRAMIMDRFPVICEYQIQSPAGVGSYLFQLQVLVVAAYGCFYSPTQVRLEFYPRGIAVPLVWDGSLTWVEYRMLPGGGLVS